MHVVPMSIYSPFDISAADSLTAAPAPPPPHPPQLPQKMPTTAVTVIALASTK